MVTLKMFSSEQSRLLAGLTSSAFTFFMKMEYLYKKLLWIAQYNTSAHFIESTSVPEGPSFIMGRVPWITKTAWPDTTSPSVDTHGHKRLQRLEICRLCRHLGTTFKQQWQLELFWPVYAIQYVVIDLLGQPPRTKTDKNLVLIITDI